MKIVGQVSNPEQAKEIEAIAKFWVVGLRAQQLSGRIRGKKPTCYKILSPEKLQEILMYREACNAINKLPIKDGVNNGKSKDNKNP